MRVSMKQQVSGTRNGQDWPAPGEEIDVPDDEAVALCSAGIAEPVGEKPEPEKRPARSKPETRRIPLVPGPAPDPQSSP